jgi:23S rRNA pseudouridine955/2504/2580 synthase
MRVSTTPKPRARPVEYPVVFEDEGLLVVDKPAGVAVHGGSGVSFGVIESLRASRSQVRFLELVHRLDRETSGLILVAKKRSVLTGLHSQMRDGAVYKRYQVLVMGNWTAGRKTVALPLSKHVSHSGERRVSVDRASGAAATTEFFPVQAFSAYTLLSAVLHTGRTHQIRVHLAHLGFPIVGDDKYGKFQHNRVLEKSGLSRMFLHAAEIRFRHPISDAALTLTAELPEPLADFLATLA